MSNKRQLVEIRNKVREIFDTHKHNWTTHFPEPDKSTENFLVSQIVGRIKNTCSISLQLKDKSNRKAHYENRIKVLEKQIQKDELDFNKTSEIINERGKDYYMDLMQAERNKGYIVAMNQTEIDFWKWYLVEKNEQSIIKVRDGDEVNKATDGNGGFQKFEKIETSLIKNNPSPESETLETPNEKESNQLNEVVKTTIKEDKQIEQPNTKAGDGDEVNKASFEKSEVQNIEAVKVPLKEDEQIERPIKSVQPSKAKVVKGITNKKDEPPESKLEIRDPLAGLSYRQIALFYFYLSEAGEAEFEFHGLAKKEIKKLAKKHGLKSGQLFYQDYWLTVPDTHNKIITRHNVNDHKVILELELLQNAENALKLAKSTYDYIELTYKNSK